MLAALAPVVETALLACIHANVSLWKLLSNFGSLRIPSICLGKGFHCDQRSSD